MKQLIIPALLALMIAGCSSTPDGSEQDGAPVESRNSGVATVNAGGIDGRNLPAVLTDPKSILSKRSTCSPSFVTNVISPSRTYTNSSSWL